MVYIWSSEFLDIYFRIRLNCVGILDVLTFDSQGNPLAAIQHYQVKNSIIVLKIPALSVREFHHWSRLL